MVSNPLLPTPAQLGRKLTLEDLIAAELTPKEVTRLIYDWSLWARPAQLPPHNPQSANYTPEDPALNWEIWLALAGRGWGKTRTGAETVLDAVENGYRRIAILAPTTADTRDVVTEGESGIMSVSHPSKRPTYEPSKRRLTFPNGAIATLYSAEEPERLRGPQHDFIWCLAKDTLVHTQLGLVPIHLIDPQVHKAWTPWGYRRIYNRVQTHPSKPTWTLSLQSGKMITGTSDHPCYERGSFTQLKDLKCATSVKSIEESLTTLDRVEDTSEGKFTWSMKLRLARYLPGMRFIIRTLTGRRIQLRIWKRSLQMNILGYMLKLVDSDSNPDMTRQDRSNAPVSNARDPSLPNRGERAETSQNSVQESALRIGEKSSSLLKSAFAKFVSPITRRLSRFKSIVARSAMEELIALEGQSLISDPVLSVERSLNQAVYDLGVEGGVFFANGVLVHNCDEIAAWQYPQETWDMAMFGLRLGRLPRVFISTTPKPIPLIRKLIERSRKEPKTVVLTTGSTYENRDNLARTFFSQVAQYEGTRLGRQELHAELIDPRESGIIKGGWFRLYPANLPTPQFVHILQSYDTAFTEKTMDRKTKDPDPSAQSTWGVFAITQRLRDALPQSIPKHIEYGVMLLDCWSDHLGFPELRVKVKKEYDTSYYGPDGDARRADTVLIEDKGSGISLRQDLQSVVPVRAYNPGRADKVERLHAVSHIPCQGMVFIPESIKNKGKPVTWSDAMLDQVCSFPLVEHDDYVDTFSQALQYLKDLGFLSIDEIVYEEDYADNTQKRVNPYGV